MCIPSAAHSTLSPFFKLSHTTLGHLLTFLDREDLGSCTQISKKLSNIIVTKTIAIKCNELNFFVERVCLTLKENTKFTDLRKKCLIDPEKGATALSTLRGLDTYVSSTRDQVISALVDLSEEELRALQGASIQRYCENIWEVAKICKRIPPGSAKTNISLRAKFYKISLHLAKVGDFNRAISLAGRIPRIAQINPGGVTGNTVITVANGNQIVCGSEKPLREKAFAKISGALAENRRFGKATAMANRVADESMRGRALAMIQALEKRIDAAVLIAQSVPHKPTCHKALRDISVEVMKTRDIDRFDRATAIANSIQDETKRQEALLIVLALAGQVDAAILSAKGPLEFQCDKTLVHMSKALTAAGKISEAVKVACSIPNYKTINRVLCHIFKELTGKEASASISSNVVKHIAHALLERGKFDEAVDVAKGIQIHALRDDVLLTLSMALLKAKETDRAFEIYKMMDAYDAKTFWASVVETNEVDRAIALIHGILPDMAAADRAWCGLSKALVKADNTRKAVEMIGFVQDMAIRGEAMRYFCKSLTVKGQADSAISLARSMLSAHFERALLGVIKGFLKLGQFDRAIAEADGIEDLEALTWISQELMRAGEIDRAEALLNDKAEQGLSKRRKVY